MTDIDLTPKQKILLKKVRKLEKPTHSSIHEEEEVQDYGIKKRTVESQMRKLEENKLVESSRPKNAKVYELTSNGSSAVDRIKKRERQRLEKKKEELTYSEIVEEFEEFFTSRDACRAEISKAAQGRGYVHLDHEELLKFNTELGEKLIEEPDEVFKACREAVSGLPDLTEAKNIRPINFMDIDKKKISDIESGDIEQLVSVEGVIQSVSGSKSDLTSAIFECVQCGDRYEKEQDSGKLKSPYKCECGSRKFDTEEKIFQTIRLLHIKEKPDQASRDTITVILEGDLAEDRNKNLDALGSGITVYGHVENYKQKKNSEYYDHRLKAKNIEIEQDKWEELEITEEDIEEFQEISERDNLPKYLRQSLAHEELVGQELLKEAFLLFPLSRTEHTEANTHFLCIGEPSTGKSHLASTISEAMPRVLKTTLSSGSTKVGLTGAVTKNEVTDQWEAESGAIPMSDGGFHITDEIDKPARNNSELLSAYNEPLSDKQVTLNKANIHTELSADVSEFAIGNPKSRRFDSHEEKHKQNPIEDADLNSRFPIKLAVARNRPDKDDKNSSIQQERKKAYKVIDRGDSGDPEENLMNTEQVVKYLVNAQELEPRLPENIKDKIVDQYMSLWQGSTGSKMVTDARFLEALISISVAYAKMHLSEEVTEDHVKYANSFIGRCYRSLDFTLGSDDARDLNDPVGRSKNKIIEKVEDLTADSRGGSVKVEKVIQESSMAEKRAEDTLENLKSDGVIYEPESGKVAKL
jgi:DNA replicative helicase MCM subunit Mcm2 (Cdc46/Mcm family)